jgi:glutathione synthase/RimK-type ligase-like ATP-grasp enzyme
MQHDFNIAPGGEAQSFSDRWKYLAAQAGVVVKNVDVFKPGALDAIRGCDGFMWRYGYNEPELGFAKRFLSAVEHGMGIPVYPAWKTSWHFEDKIAQSYLLEAAGIPVPKTWTFWTEADALKFCRSAQYPFVAKLAAGIQSKNVTLVHDRAQAERLTKAMFGAGVHTLFQSKVSLKRAIGRIKAVRTLRGLPIKRERRQLGYLYAQEFLPGNDFDTRVTVIGNRALAFRRFNREGDFRASGSGEISWDPSAIDLEIVQLAFTVARALETQSVAVDGLRRGDTRLLAEISYTCAARGAIAACPGHWTQDPHGNLLWIEGQLRAEDAIFDDFVSRLEGRSNFSA